MKAFFSIILIFSCVGFLLSGCGAKEVAIDREPVAFSESRAQSAIQDTAVELETNRLLTWKAYLTIEVTNVSEGMHNAIAIAEQFKGYMEHKTDNGEKSASVRLRIPAATFKSAVGAIEQLGDILHRSVAAEDVTEQYVDVEARLKNKKELRDRLRQLLQKATNVKDIIMIETELNRVQSDIDSMEARIRTLKGRVDFAIVDLTLKRGKVLGPLGYILDKLWWGIEKLFVIRH